MTKSCNLQHTIPFRCVELFKMVQRLTYRRRHCYATRSNKTRVVKTPGSLAWTLSDSQQMPWLLVNVAVATAFAFSARSRTLTVDEGPLLSNRTKSRSKRHWWYLQSVSLREEVT